MDACALRAPRPSTTPPKKTLTHTQASGLTTHVRRPPASPTRRRFSRRSWVRVHVCVCASTCARRSVGRSRVRACRVCVRAVPSHATPMTGKQMQMHACADFCSVHHAYHAGFINTAVAVINHAHMRITRRDRQAVPEQRRPRAALLLPVDLQADDRVCGVRARVCACVRMCVLPLTARGVRGHRFPAPRAVLPAPPPTHTHTHTHTRTHDDATAHAASPAPRSLSA